MPGGVPATILNTPDGGIDIAGSITSAVYNYHSPFLLSGLSSKDVRMQAQKRGEQFAVDVRGTAGTRVIGQNFNEVAGFENATTTLVASTCGQIVSTANLGSNNTLTYPMHWQNAYQGGAFNPGNQFSNSAETLAKYQVLADVQSAIAQVTRRAEKQMFAGIFANNYVSKSSPSGAAMTTTTETFSSHVTHTPLYWTPKLVDSTNQQNTGVEIDRQQALAYFSRDASGYSLQSSNQAGFHLLPDWMFSAISAPLSLVHPSYMRHNAPNSDASFNPLNALFNTYNNMTNVCLDYTWFYTITTGEPAVTYYITIMVNYDAIAFYSPLQNGNMVDMLRNGFNSAPGFTQIPQLQMNGQLAQFLTDNGFGAGPHPAYNASQIMGMSGRFSDPVTRALHEGIISRYPSVAANGSDGYYSPLCYSIKAFQHGPDTSPTLSWQTSLEINKFAGSLRRMPQYIIPIYIDPALISSTPPSYTNPISATYAAFNTLSQQQFVEWAYDNADLVEYDLGKEHVHTGIVLNDTPFEGTTREIIEQSVGKDYKRGSQIHHETMFEKTLKGYDKMTSQASKSAKVPQALQAAQMREKLGEKIKA